MAEIAPVLGVVTSYVAVLFAIALWVERGGRRGRAVASTPLVYTLSLAVYATTWTFYGSIGYVVSHGLLFATIYVGPTLAAFGWPWLLRKMVRLKELHRVTTLPDLLALRYGKSQAVAAIATLVAVVGLVPYVAIQLKTMIQTVGIVAGQPRSAYPAIGDRVGPPLVALMLVFTVAFGLRRVRPTERHPGMMVAIAAESVVKLAAFLAGGVFVTYGLFDGFGDVFGQALARRSALPPLLGEGHGVTSWLTHLLLAASAFLFLPRQFHVAVVENSSEDHIRSASWALPAYLVAINLFVLPVALGGLVLGFPESEAELFVLTLPRDAGATLVSWLVFLGGFSAGTGMIVVETMALATMISNHLVLPAADLWGRLAGARRRVLLVRWIGAATVLVAAFAYERAFGDQYTLVTIGLASFAAVLQLAPATVAGLLWRRGSTAGALAGCVAGFATWAYTLVVPVFARSGWLPGSVVTEGPLGIGALRPEALFGVGELDELSHAVLWSMLANVAGYVFGSLFRPAPAAEEARAESIVRALQAHAAAGEGAPGAAIADAAEKRRRIVSLLVEYQDRGSAEALAAACLTAVAPRQGTLSALQLAELEAEVETALASSIGTAAAHAALRRHEVVTEEEGRAVSAAYADLIAQLRIPPAELRRRIDYHRERERLLAHDAVAQRFLADVSGRLGASLDPDATARAIVRLPVPDLVGAACLWIGGPDGQGSRVLFASASIDRERAGTAVLEPIAAAFAEIADVARAIASGRPATGPPEGWPAPLRDAVPFVRAVTFALASPRGTLGTLSLLASEGDPLRLPEDLALGEELARRAAVALDNAMLHRSTADAVRARDEFLAVASHELKNPLTPLQLGIQVLGRLIERGELARLPAERVASLFRSAELQVGRLTRLVEDLLDVSRITTGRLRLNLEQMDLAAVAREVAERHEAQLAQAGCALTISAEPGATGTWDRLRIEQVLSNLLGNAAKYAPGTPIEVSVEADVSWARLTVRDHGPGIAPEDQERIFLPFERAVPYLRVAGFGLGLYVVRQAVAAHGGTVRLESAAGAGSTFVVELPRAGQRTAP